MKFTFTFTYKEKILCFDNEITIKIKKLMFIDKKVLTYVKNYYILHLTINVNFLLFIVFLAREVKLTNKNVLL